MKIKLKQVLWTLCLLSAVGCGPTHDMPEAGSAPPPPVEEHASETSLLVPGGAGMQVTTDLVWRNTATGANLTWRMDGATRINTGTLTWAAVDQKLEASADMNLDGYTDLIWRNSSTRQIQIWLMSNEQRTSTVSLPTVPDANWYIGGAGDMDGDGDQDLVLRNSSTGSNLIWLMDKTTFQQSTALTSVGTAWLLRGVGDLNADGHADLVWRNSSTGANWVWFMNRTTYSSGATITTVSNLQVSLETVADLDWDGRADLVWRDRSNGTNTVWYMNGATTRSTATLTAESSLGLRIVGTRRGQALVVPLSRALSARLNFLGTHDTAPTVRSVAATQDNFATSLGVASYEVKVGSVVQPESGLYLGITGRDSAGNVRVVLDIALSKAAAEAMYQAVTTTNPPVPPQSTLPNGILLLQVSSATNDTQSTLHSGLMANVTASLQAAGQLGTSGGTVSAASLTSPVEGTAKGPRPVNPSFDDEDRGILRSCWDTLLGTVGATLGCTAALLGLATPATSAAAWAVYLTCLGSVPTAIGTLPSCLCTSGIAPFGQETWNEGDGLASCSCARTTGQADAWMGSSPRGGGQSACAYCPSGTTRAVIRELSCYAADCMTVNETQDYCACPQGTTWNGSSCVPYSRTSEYAVVRGVTGCNPAMPQPIAVNPCTGRTWYQNQGANDRTACVVPYTDALSTMVEGTPACRAPTRTLTYPISCTHTFYASNGAALGNLQGSACFPNVNLDEDVSEPYILDFWTEDEQGYCVCSAP